MFTEVTADQLHLGKPALTKACPDERQLLGQKLNPRQAAIKRIRRLRLADTKEPGRSSHNALEWLGRKWLLLQCPIMMRRPEDGFVEPLVRSFSFPRLSGADVGNSAAAPEAGFVGRDAHTTARVPPRKKGFVGEAWFPPRQSLAGLLGRTTKTVA